MFRGYLYALLTCVMVGCASSEADYTQLQGSMLGTTYHITALLDNPNRATIQRLLLEIEELDAKMKREISLFDPESQLSRINRDESNTLTPWLKANILLADSISRVSGGVYDITVAPLVKAWGFARSSEQILHPNIDSLIKFVGFELISVEGDSLIKRDRRVQIDLNSIAKGFAVDRLADILESHNSQNYIVDIGGEIRSRGLSSSQRGWRVGVESPIDGNMSEGEMLQRRIEISPDYPYRGVATSGNYRRFYISEEGKKIVHTIDPRSGMSNPSRLLSVTVLAQTCALADGYATMFLSAGEAEAEALAAKIENCEVYMIFDSSEGTEGTEGTESYREYASEGMKRMLMQ